MNEIWDIINKIDPLWDKDLIIRFLTRRLSPLFQSDLEYFMLSEKEKVKLFNSGYTPQFPNVNCLTLCQFYQNIFQEFGIRSKIINANNGDLQGRVPLYTLIVEGSNSWYYINPIKDLYTNGLSISTLAYGHTPSCYTHLLIKYPYLKDLDINYINELDRKLGIKNNDSIFKENISLIKNPTKFRMANGIPRSAPIEEAIYAKLRIIGDTYINIGRVDGLLERNEAYQYFFRNTFTAPESKHLSLNMDIKNKRVKIIVNPNEEQALFEEEKNNGTYILVRKK